LHNQAIKQYGEQDMSYPQTAVKQHIQTAQVTCPTQILVIDRDNGPAAILMDTVSRLVEKEISLYNIDESREALKQLERQGYDLLVIGLESGEALSVLPYIRVQHPNLPVMVVGYRVRPADRACAQHFQVQEIIDLPARANKMKSLASYLVHRYL
jgi:DNA-binding NtrC family response regulator